MEIKEREQKILDRFSGCPTWEERYREIIALGHELEPLDEEYRTEENKIEGCQSQVWVHARLEDGKIYFQADSDALIVKGLIAILIKVYSGEAPDVILSNPPEFLKETGIYKHLSPTRNNGLAAMIRQISMYAIAYRALLSKKTE